jgi:hypothetical protein
MSAVLNAALIFCTQTRQRCETGIDESFGLFVEMTDIPKAL